MLPILSSNDFSDTSVTNPKFYGEPIRAFSVRSSFSNFYDLWLSQFRRIRLLALTLPIFPNFISVIIRFRSDKKMIWANAKSNVAFMQDTFSYRNFTMIKSPSDTMHEIMGCRSHFHYAVSILLSISSTCPNPTFWCLLCASKKALLNSFHGYIVPITTRSVKRFLYDLPELQEITPFSKAPALV